MVVALYDQEQKETSRIPAIEAMIADCDRRKDNLIRAIEQGIAPQEMKKRIDEVMAEKSTLETELARLYIETPTITIERITYWLSLFKDGDIKSVSYRKAIADTLINSIRVSSVDGGKAREIIIGINITGYEEVKLYRAYKPLSAAK